jgi:polar amino acid transport system substrate-binding protein
VAMAVAKGNKSVLDALNKALADLMKDGTYAQISKKWFGEDVRCR